MEIKIFAAIFSDFRDNKEILIVLVRLILEKVGIDEFTGPQQEIKIRNEFGLKVFLNRFRLISNTVVSNPYTHSTTFDTQSFAPLHP